MCNTGAGLHDAVAARGPSARLVPCPHTLMVPREPKHTHTYRTKAHTHINTHLIKLARQRQLSRRPPSLHSLRANFLSNPCYSTNLTRLVKPRRQAAGQGLPVALKPLCLLVAAQQALTSSSGSNRERYALNG